MKTYLVADSGYNKEQLSNIAETICPNFREHEEKRLEKNVPLSHGIARYRTTDKSGFRIFASWFRKRAKSLAQLEKNISLIGEIKKKMKPRLQASKRVVSQSTSSKRNLRKEEKAKLNRGQKKSWTRTWRHSSGILSWRSAQPSSPSYPAPARQDS